MAGPILRMTNGLSKFYFLAIRLQEKLRSFSGLAVSLMANIVHAQWEQNLERPKLS
jgi:hypothetical protein